MMDRDGISSLCGRGRGGGQEIIVRVMKFVTDMSLRDFYLRNLLG